MRPGEEASVYLCRELVDMRKSINGLSILVEEALGLNPFGPELFVFCNRKRDKLKILYWGAPGETWSWRTGGKMDP
jgi:transposase